MFERLLDLLFPRTSLTGKEGQWITDAERKNIRLIPVLQHKDLLKKRGLRSLDAIIAAGSYDSSPLLRKAILTFKYKRIRSLSTDLGTWMTKALHGLHLPPESFKFAPPILCPVPLHWTRRATRGFNQAELLADCIAKETGWIHTSLLKRTRNTGHQAWRQKNERLTALQGAFTYTGTNNAPKYVMLIDDLSTTGATLDECARILKAAGVQYVTALVTAQG